MVKLKTRLEKKIALLGLSEDRITIMKEVRSMMNNFRSEIEKELLGLGVAKENIKSDNLNGGLIFTSQNLSGNLLFHANVIMGENEAHIVLTTKSYAISDKYGIMPSQN